MFLAALTFLSMKTRNYQNYPFRPPLWSEVPATRTSDTPAHHNVALSEGGHDLESLLLKHRDGSEVFPVGSPANDRIGFNDAPSLVSYGLHRGFQRGARYPPLAMLSVNGKASYSPQSLCAAFTGRPSVDAVVVETGKLLTRAVLAPSHRFIFRVDQDPVRRSTFDEFSPSLAVSRGSLYPGEQLLVHGGASSMVIRAPAREGAGGRMFLEKSLEVWQRVLC